MAVVGLGYWGPNLARNINELPDAELAMVCDSRPSALAKFAQRYPAVATTDDYHGVIADPTIDAILLATPVSTHYALACAPFAQASTSLSKSLLPALRRKPRRSSRSQKRPVAC